MARTTRSTLALVATAATAALLALLGLLHVIDFQHHVTTRLAHHRSLQALETSPSLQLLFHAKRDTLTMHGHGDFTVFVQPTATPSVFEFNGMATFIDGETTHTYKLVDGVAYYTQATAEETTSVVLPASTLPPVQDLLAAIASATPIDKLETTQTIDCPIGATLFHTHFNSMNFVLCRITTSDDVSGVRIFGADFNVEIRPSATPVEITKPTSVTALPLGAAEIVPPSTRRMTTASSLLMTTLTQATKDAMASPTDRTRRLADATCGCKSTPRPCIFFHGMDVKADGGLVDEYAAFGDIKKHAPCCSSIKFALLNTVDYGWTNATLVDKVCDYALSMSPSSDKLSGTIENTIVVGHSMGNLLVAHAEASGKCKLAPSSSWVALSGPMRGSMGSDFQQCLCEGNYFGKEIVAGIVKLFGQCPQSRARQTLYYEGGNYSTPLLNAQYEAAQLVHQQRVTAGVCGSTFNGLPSGDWLGLVFGGSILPHKSKENDGVVEFQSCIGRLPASTFGETWSSPFYRGKLNHADTTFKNGDSWFDDAQKPVKWFECLPL